MAKGRGEKGDELQESMVSDECFPRSGGIVDSCRHAEQADALDEEEEEAFFLFFFFFFLPPRFFFPPLFFFFFFWAPELELPEDEVTGAAMPLPLRDSS